MNSFIFSTFSVVCSYRFEQMTVNDSRKSINTVRVRTTAVYTVMFVDTDEKQVCVK
jgi:hypothetical protein